MIRSIKVELNAAFPNMPLLPFHVFHGSAAAITVLNVPRRIVSLSVKVKNVSAADRAFPAQRSGSAWVAVIPGSFFEQSGTSTRGVKIEGVDEAGNIYTLGAADLVVMLDNGTVSPVAPSVVDDTVTQGSPRPVKSSGIWAAIWGESAALPTGFPSLYDWCAAQLAALQSGKRDKDDLIVYPKRWITTGIPNDVSVSVGPQYDDGFWVMVTSDGTVWQDSVSGEDADVLNHWSASGYVEYTPVSRAEKIATESQLSQNDYTDEDKAEVAKVKDKADEFSEWMAGEHIGTLVGQPYVSNEGGFRYIWATEGDTYFGRSVYDSEEEIRSAKLTEETFLLDNTFGEPEFTATRKRVLRTGDAPATSDIIDPALAAAVGKIADAKLTRDFVNTMVSTNSAHYLTARAGTAGAYTYPPFASASALRAAVAAHTEQNPQFFYAGEAFTPTKNDWVIVSEDEDHPLGTITPASRYGFVGTFGSGGSFQYQVSYKLPLTTAQIAALDSGITAAILTWLTTFKGTDSATTLASILAKLAHLESDGTADDTFATDLLGKQVAISAIDARIKTNAESAAEPTNAVTLNDNAPKTVTVATVESPATPSLAVTFGAARNGGLRICELYILNGTADTDLTFDAATVSFVATGDSFPACEAGINYFVFAEVAANLWKVTRETLKSITTPTPVAAE